MKAENELLAFAICLGPLIAYVLYLWFFQKPLHERIYNFKMRIVAGQLGLIDKGMLKQVKFCSVCKSLMRVGEDPQLKDNKIFPYLLDYCPNCEVKISHNEPLEKGEYCHG